MSYHKLLKTDVEHADACMLLTWLATRTQAGNLAPVTTREALEAIHRKQGRIVMPLEAAHFKTVLQRVDAACRVEGIPYVSACLHGPIGGTPGLFLQARDALDKLPYIPVADIANPEP